MIKFFAQSFETHLLTGHIYGEKLQLRNHGDIIEVAIPTSINERILVWVCSGDREWTTKSKPNQVLNLFYSEFVEKIKKNSLKESASCTAS